jgi:IS30 family transposase
MKHYSQLTLEQRYGIYSFLKTGQTQKKIAEIIGVHKSTVCRELKRNRGRRGYRYKQANALAEQRRHAKPRTRIDGSTWVFIKELICNEWSPEQISGWMKQNMKISISHEWIYQYILKDKQAGASLHLHLRCKKKETLWIQ